MMRVMVRKDYSGMRRADRRMMGGAENATKTMAEMLKNDIRASWSGTSPSSIGSPPAVVSGDLDASITLEKAGRDDLGRFATPQNATGWLLRFGEAYAALLENPVYAPPSSYRRPFLAPAIERGASAYPFLFKRTL